MTIGPPDWGQPWQAVWDAVVWAATGGGSWPEADEDRIRQLGQEWRNVSELLGDHLAQAGQQADALQGLWQGQSGDAFHKLWRQYADQDLPQYHETLGSLADRHDDAARDVEYTKLTIIFEVGLLMAEIFAIIVLSFITFGGALAAAAGPIAWTRLAVSQAIRALVEAASRGFLRTVLKEIALEGLQELAVDAAAQAAQMLMGTRTGWDAEKSGWALAGGGTAGLFGGLTAPAVNRLVRNVPDGPAGAVTKAVVNGVHEAGVDTATNTTLTGLSTGDWSITPTVGGFARQVAAEGVRGAVTDLYHNRLDTVTNSAPAANSPGANPGPSVPAGTAANRPATSADRGGSAGNGPSQAAAGSGGASTSNGQMASPRTGPVVSATPPANPESATHRGGEPARSASNGTAYSGPGTAVAAESTAPSLAAGPTSNVAAQPVTNAPPDNLTGRPTVIERAHGTSGELPSNSPHSGQQNASERGADAGDSGPDRPDTAGHGGGDGRGGGSGPPPDLPEPEPEPEPEPGLQPGPQPAGQPDSPPQQPGSQPERVGPTDVSAAMRLATAARGGDGSRGKIEAVLERLDGYQVGDGSPHERLTEFVSEALGQEVSLVPVGRGEGLGGSGAPVYLVFAGSSREEDAAPIAIAKTFPAAYELVHELSAMERLQSDELRNGEPVAVGTPSPLAVGVISNADGTIAAGILVSSVAAGASVYDLLHESTGTTGPRRQRHLADLHRATAEVAASMARLHTAPSGSGATTIADQDVRLIQESLDQLAASDDGRISGLDFETVPARLSRLATEAASRRQGAALSHNDAHVANVFWDQNADVTFIDVTDLHRSMDADGRPIGAPELDVARFTQILAYQGSVAQLTPAELAALHETFQTAYEQAGGPYLDPVRLSTFSARDILGRMARAARRPADARTTQTLADTVKSKWSRLWQLNSQLSQSLGDQPPGQPAVAAGTPQRLHEREIILNTLGARPQRPVSPADIVIPAQLLPSPVARPADGVGREVRYTEALANGGVSQQELGWLEDRQALLGMTPQFYQEWTASLFAALEADGISSEEVDIRVLGSATRGFSGPHKKVPASEGSPLATYFFDMKHRGGDPEPSDYDINLSSDRMFDIALAGLTERDVAAYGKKLVIDHGYLNKQLVYERFPNVKSWSEEWERRSIELLSCVRDGVCLAEEHLPRDMSYAVFRGSGPADSTHLGHSVHFQDTDWVVRPQDGSTSTRRRAMVAAPADAVDQRRADQSLADQIMTDGGRIVGSETADAHTVQLLSDRLVTSTAALASAARLEPDGSTPAMTPSEGDRRERHRAVSVLLQAWANGPNSSDLMLALQEAAAVEFDLDDIGEWNMSQARRTIVEEMVRQHSTAYRAFLRVQYEITQEILARYDLSEVTVYRGFAWADVDYPAWAAGAQGDVVSLPSQRPLSSWTSMASIAADWFDSRQLPGVVVAARVPAGQILSLPLAGFGSQARREVVIIHGTGEVALDAVRRPVDGSET